MNKNKDAHAELSKQVLDVLLSLNNERYYNQRLLSENTGFSLGTINKSLKILNENGYIDEDVNLTAKAKNLIKRCKPQRAVILAAGFGMRMVPINTSSPKALLEVKGEVLIERQIRQLIEAGIKDISVVVGFMKESFDYLVDKFGVDLIYNNCYSTKNNIYSVNIVADKLKNCYIVPCDLWCEFNPFNKYELYSWYMVTDSADENSTVRVNRKNELVNHNADSNGNRMIGISYLLEDEANMLSDKLAALLSDGRHNESFWEEALLNLDRMYVYARVVPDAQVKEINTYEQLRELDSDSGHLKNDAIGVITKTFKCKPNDIKDITVMKKGMTNRSFIFTVNNQKYIMRIPGEGTDQLINREQEAAVFRAISKYGFCDDPIYINPQNGYKITKYLEGARTCNPENEDDLKKCMARLKSFHDSRIRVNHCFDIFGQIDFYESLWNGNPSVFRDYEETKANVLSLISIIDSIDKDYCLTHIDAVPDNFLFYKPLDSECELLQLTDWEYSGMQDPHVDIAMFCIYCLFDKNKCDHVIDVYFDGKCDVKTRGKIYCYIASCGLLWSNWCEYKRQLGVEFGEYIIRQYRYAKDFYRYAKELL